MTDDDVLLEALELDIDLEDATSWAGVSLCVVRAVMEHIVRGDLRRAEAFGRLFRLVGPWPLGFGQPEAWDPSRDAVATIVDGGGRPVAVVDTALLIRP